MVISTLLENLTNRLYHDEVEPNGTDETDRLKFIEYILKYSGYYQMKIGLCNLFFKVAPDMSGEPVTIISSHIDTHLDITKPFIEQIGENKIIGTFDNSITNAAVLVLMLDDMLPDNVAVAFTGGEEYGLIGANDLAEYLSGNGINARIIVTDVTDRGYKEKAVASVENRCNSTGWSSYITGELFDETPYTIHYTGNHEDDETAAYDNYGIECFSLCIPTKGEMHSNKGLKARISSLIAYTRLLHLAAANIRE